MTHTYTIDRLRALADQMGWKFDLYAHVPLADLVGTHREPGKFGQTHVTLTPGVVLTELEARLKVDRPLGAQFGQRIALCEAAVCPFSPNSLIVHDERGLCEFVRKLDASRAIVRYPDDDREHVADIRHLKEKPAMSNYKTQTTDAIDKLMADVPGLTVKENETRRLGIAYVLASQGDAAKQRVKKALKKLGIIPGKFVPDSESTLLDTRNFLLRSKTSQPAFRLTEAALIRALEAEPRVTGPMRARILAAAKEETKAATTFMVEQR